MSLELVNVFFCWIIFKVDMLKSYMYLFSYFYPAFWFLEVPKAAHIN